ncbi:carbohydrate ABC transporter permease [Paenibacillus sp. BC26]|uniref:carbohydrate ABC transporter permease n=1 Tax=Paenibacillus sp. BC26 TaxID=1881032 RepID=UPI0008E795B5|nr:carbohydrate ABC transporter permease [Paenibacillus sp. BC26]SFS57798.1 putative aldouronate transport system permease protein [Paenibacillus sp. BC26]
MKESRGDQTFKLISYLFIALFALFCLIPFWLMVAGSLSTEKELLLSGYSLIPKELSTAAYEAVLRSPVIKSSYMVTAFITITGTLIGLTVSSMLAYSIASRRNPLRNGIGFYVYFTMLFQGGMVPFYILMSNWLHLSDSLWALILPIAVQPFYVFLMVSFFRTIPDDLEEAGRIDGANELTVFFRIIVPVSKPIIASVGLFLALAYWNDWFMGLLFITDDSKFPLQLVLRRLISNIEASKRLMPAGANYVTDFPSLAVRMATTLITIGPIVMLYPLLQKYFVKGLTIGAIKG